MPPLASQFALAKFAVPAIGFADCGSPAKPTIDSLLAPYPSAAMVIKLFRKLGVQSKVLAMVLLASLLSLLLTGLVSYNIGSNVLSKAVTNQLIALRDSRAEAIKNYFGFLSNHVLTMQG
jgi:hypothetical protein